MNTLLQKLAIAATTAFLGTTVATTAQAFDFSFNEEFYNEIDPGALSGTLSGGFSGVDLNSNGRIEANELTAFSSSWNDNTGVLGNFTLELADLASFSYFANSNDYVFLAASPILERGWTSSGILNATEVGSALAVEGPISASFFSDGLTVVPTPALLPGLLGLGLSLWRKRKMDDSNA